MPALPVKKDAGRMPALPVWSVLEIRGKVLLTAVTGRSILELVPQKKQDSDLISVYDRK